MSDTKYRSYPVFGSLIIQELPLSSLGETTMTAIDPVCGMELDDSSADANLAWHDQRLLFCSEQCLRRFLDRPQAYADD